VQWPALEPGDCVAACRDRPEQKDRRRSQTGLGNRVGKPGEGRADRSLAGVGAALDRGCRLGRIAPGASSRSAIAGRLPTPM
jgi:hypothetical protein